MDNFIKDSSVVQILDGFQSRLDQKLDILQESISKLVQQFDHAEEEDLEAECLTETILVEQAQLQPQEELKMESVEAPEELQDTPESGDTFWPRKQEEQTSALISEEESQEEECLDGTIVEEPCPQQPQEILVENFESSVGAAVCLWEKKNAIPLLLIEESVEEHKENNLPLPPTDSVYILPLPAPQSQATYNPLPVYILPTPAENPKPATPAPKSKSNPLSAMQNSRS